MPRLRARRQGTDVSLDRPDDPAFNCLLNGLRAITTAGDAAPFTDAYRDAGGGYEGLQAVAEAALAVAERLCVPTLTLDEVRAAFLRHRPARGNALAAALARENASRADEPTRDVRATPVFGQDGSCRGWVRLDADRVGHADQTEFCVTVEAGSYLSPFEARAYADRLREVADAADVLLEQGRSDG